MRATLQLSVFYQWLRHALGDLGAALGPPTADTPSKREKELVAKTKELKAKLAKTTRSRSADNQTFIRSPQDQIYQPPLTMALSN